MDSCYSYPYDLLVLLACSVVLNFLLAYSLSKRIAAHDKIKKSLTNVMRVINKELK